MPDPAPVTMATLSFKFIYNRPLIRWDRYQYASIRDESIILDNERDIITSDIKKK